jgi:hypothetical protein
VKCFFGASIAEADYPKDAVTDVGLQTAEAFEYLDGLSRSSIGTLNLPT